MGAGRVRCVWRKVQGEVSWTVREATLPTQSLKSMLRPADAPCGSGRHSISSDVTQQNLRRKSRLDGVEKKVNHMSKQIRPRVVIQSSRAAAGPLVRVLRTPHVPGTVLTPLLTPSHLFRRQMGH